jgi:hypothetical protein
LQAYTLFHVVLSLVGIAAGFVIFYGMLRGQRLDRWTALFLSATIATSITGFGFPFNGITPGIILGVLSLIALAIAVWARYYRRMAGGWRTTFVISALVAQYFNVFVLIVQAFQKVPGLHALAPTQAEPPFAVAQGLNLLAFIISGFLCVHRFRGAAL